VLARTSFSTTFIMLDGRLHGLRVQQLFTHKLLT